MSNVEARLRNIEQAVIAGVMNGSQTNHGLNMDETSQITDDTSSRSAGAASGSVGGYLRSRRNSQSRGGSV